MLSNPDTTGNTSDIFIAKLDLATGINVTENNNLISIYPNPATSEILIRFGKNVYYKIQLCNALGEILKQTAINYNTTSINISSFPKGIYFIIITDNEGNKMMKKIMKM
jgi:hypothetical protein